MIYPVGGSNSEYVISSFKDFIKIFGVPRRVITDAGTAFTLQKFKIFASDLGMTHHLNAVALPRGNGQVERYNRTITESLAAMNNHMKERHWDREL